jgi:hypothetical protein
VREYWFALSFPPQKFHLAILSRKNDFVQLHNLLARRALSTRVPKKSCVTTNQSASPQLQYCLFFKSTLFSFAERTMSEQSNGQGLPPVEPPLARKSSQARYTAQTVLRTRPKTYHKVAQLLADPNWSALQISKACRVSEYTVRAIRERESEAITERKKTLAVMLTNVAEIGAGRMEATIGKASLRDATIGTGVACDKILALTGQIPSIQIANLIMPTDEEREERRQTHARLDAIVAKLSSLHQGE